MIDKDTALGLIKILSIATDNADVPYETGELESSALGALGKVLEAAEYAVENHYDDSYRHYWFDKCEFCELGLLPDKRTADDGS